MKRYLLLILLALVLTAQSPDYTVWLPIVLKAPVLENNIRIIQPLYSSNEVLNPSAENTGNFSSVSGATVARSTTYQKYGLYSYHIQSAGASDGIQLTTRTLAATQHWVTVRVRGTYTTLYAVINGNSRPMRKIEKIDANWDLYGVNFGSNLSGGTSVQIIGVANGEDYYLDGVQVEPNMTWTTYIDGTQQGCAWLGQAHAAASERSGQSRAGGTSNDFWQQYKFQVKKVVGAGASSHNLGVDSYAILPGGELNSDKISPRDWEIQGKFITDTEEELHEMRQALEAAFQTDDLQLTLIRFNGATQQKEIGVRYDGGLEGDISAFYGNVEILNEGEYNEIEKFTEDVTIQLISPNPFWFEVGESAANLDTNASATFRMVAGRLKSTGQWDVLGPPGAGGTYNSIAAIAEDDVYIYFGGLFSNFDGIANADGIVRYHKVNGTYSALSTGTSSGVAALVIGPDGTLYAGGSFTTIGGVAANRIAAWDGSVWSALGSGMNGAVSNLAIGLDGTLYAGGGFTTAGGGGANYIAAWDGSSWSALGTGMSDVVSGLAVGIDGTLFATGDFATAGGTSVNFVAGWDGSSWSALGSGLGAGGTDAAVDPASGLLYVTGSFTTAGGNSINYIASWNGTGWSGLGSGLDAAATSLSVGPDGTLYVAGNFSTAGGLTLADKIAKWNSYAWAHLDIDLPGSPIQIIVYASKYPDPVIEQNYDLIIGFDATGTGTYGGALSVTNDGSVPAFPKIVYSRSGGTTATLETLREETTGRELLFDYDLLDGETLAIDLNPPNKTIISSFFGPRLDAVLPNSDFGTWQLPRGSSTVTSYINESGTPTLEHYMLWRDAYSGYD